MTKLYGIIQDIDNPEIWEIIKEIYGRDQAVKVIMLLLQAALECKDIHITKFRDIESYELVIMETIVIDDECILIENSGGVSIEINRGG